MLPVDCSPGPPPRILVVDDDELMRAILRRVFMDADLQVETFESARDLLDNADFREPALLLLDVVMPGISGIQLQAMLRERGIALPVVFLTGLSDVPMAVDAMRNGAVDFIEKPFDKRLLVERVRQNLAAASTPEVGQARAADSRHAASLKTLTGREREVHDLMITGRTSKMIARDLGGSFRTIEIHRSRVMAKMEATSLAELVRMNYESVSDGPAPRV